MIEVPAGRVSTLGLGDFEMEEHKITIKIVIGEYEKILVNNVIVKRVEDIRIKVRQDLSVKNVGEDEFKKLLKKSEGMTNPVMSDPAADKMRV